MKLFSALNDKIILTFINVVTVTNDIICKLIGKLDSPDQRSPYLTDLVMLA